ncbi:MAG: type II secretion system protein N [Caulobacter sp.]|nr:type II secretion system protein N [Caulobacter sp.]
MRLPDLSSLVADPQRSLWVATEVLIVVLLGVQTARLGWIAVSPSPVPAPAVNTVGEDRLAILKRFDPFFRAAPEALTTATTQAFRLHGVRVGGGGSGSAIIGTPDGLQRSFAVGDEVAPNVRLVSVAEDHVVLARGGVRSTLHFPSAEPGVPESMVQP